MPSPDTATRTEPGPSVLVVGAGAVGQVYGYHLRRGGAEVTFLVRPRYAEEARRGFHLYPLRRRRPREVPVSFRDFGVATSVDEVGAGRWDAVVLCVSSTALRAGDWLERVAASTGDATVLGLQPGPEDPSLVGAHAGPERLVWGMITLIAYAAPLPGEEVPQSGVAYWVPPFTAVPLSGPEERVRPIAGMFRRGGMRARVVPDVAPTIALGGPALNLHVAALECAGWRLDALRRDRPLLDLTGAAVREVTAAVAHRLDVKPPPWLSLLRPWLVRLALRFAPTLLPLDLETYLRVHFSKVREQTLLLIDQWESLAAESGGEGRALRALRDRLLG